MKSLTVVLAASIALAAAPALVRARALPEDVARLGADLTPLGAEREGNAEGSIPAWTGGITQPPPDYVTGMHHPDPYARDPILFTIDQSNLERHVDRLTAGHVALLRTYPSFRVNVYPTRRSAAAPQRIYEATLRIAPNATLTANGTGVTGAVNGVPFPIPRSGLEVIWNHILRWRADTVARQIAQAAPTRGGAYSLIQFEDEIDFSYHHEGMTEALLDNVIARFKQKVTAPAPLAGTIFLAHETLDQGRQHRRAWVYSPGQRRVRRAPNIAFDSPGAAADGQRTSDQFDLFNGSPERYDWKLVGKREIYVPYNSYKLHSDGIDYTQILLPLHINPDLARYELHRVWVVEATLKDGARHVYKRRTFYVDEDSWQIAAVDQYDSQGTLWRVSEGHAINYYEVPTFWYTLEVHYDLQNGRYLAIGLDNQSGMYDFGIERTAEDFTAAALRREGRR